MNNQLTELQNGDTIAAMILQSDAGSGINKTSQKRRGKQRKVANKNESDSSISDEDAIVVVAQKTKKKR